MRNRQLELMQPDEIDREKEILSLIYIPIAPLEWHGPHLPFGTDPLNAHRLCLELAGETGGVVHPPLYAGTDIIRSEKAVRRFGFEKYYRIMGMDFPGFPVKSFYWKESVFKNIVTEIVNICQRNGYRYIVLMSGHGGENHTKIMTEVSHKLTTPMSRVIYFITFWTKKGPMKNIGHADKYETSLTLRYSPSLVDLNKLPAKGPIKCKDFGIVDSDTFAYHPTKDFTCRSDPRKANVLLGKKVVEKSKKEILKILRRYLNENRL